jgi:hypothetical protein
MASKGHLCSRAYIEHSARIQFVVRPNERNVLEQRRLESRSISSFVFYTIPTLALLDRHGIHVIRQTLADLAVSAFLSPSMLAITIPSASSLRNRPSTYEISAIYSCTPYTPSDFPAPSYYDTYFLLERRRAIKCPLLLLQLAGGKKVQEALSRPGMLEGFLGNEGARGSVGAHRSHCTQQTSVPPDGGMWALDSGCQSCGCD